jgi:hypothetical protein
MSVLIISNVGGVIGYEHKPQYSVGALPPSYGIHHLEAHTSKPTVRV